MAIPDVIRDRKNSPQASSSSRNEGRSRSLRVVRTPQLPCRIGSGLLSAYLYRFTAGVGAEGILSACIHDPPRRSGGLAPPQCFDRKARHDSFADAMASGNPPPAGHGLQPVERAEGRRLAALEVAAHAPAPVKNAAITGSVVSCGGDNRSLEGNRRHCSCVRIAPSTVALPALACARAGSLMDAPSSPAGMAPPRWSAVSEAITFSDFEASLPRTRCPTTTTPRQAPQGLRPAGNG